MTRDNASAGFDLPDDRITCHECAHLRCDDQCPKFKKNHGLHVTRDGKVTCKLRYGYKGAKLCEGVCYVAGTDSQAKVIAMLGYSPIQDMKKRCEGFQPKGHIPDQRGGEERWPWLMEYRAKPRENPRPDMKSSSEQSLSETENDK